MRSTLILTAIIISISATLFAQGYEDYKTEVPQRNVYVNPSKNEFMLKVGTGYAKDPGKFGLDVSLNYIYNIDPVFVFGFEGDFFWINWKSKLQDINIQGAGGSVNAKTDLYTIPLFANAQVRLPFLRNKIYVEPAFTIGIGYAFMILDYSSDDNNGTKLYSGLALQGFASAYYKMLRESAVDFVLDLGYRRLPLDKGKTRIDMSGFIARLGVKFYI